MYDQIRHRIEHRLNRRPPLRLERVSVGDDDGERDTALISAHATAELERQMDGMYDERDAAEAAEHTADSARLFGGLRSRQQLQNHLVERVVADIAAPQLAYDFTITGGSRILAPPYDREWAVGTGVAFGARVDGKVMTLPDDNGFSAAGIGLYLTVDQPVLAAITPHGSYDWNWVAFQDLPFARSSGGLGITIYTDGRPQPTTSALRSLWNVSGMTQFSGQKGNGRIADVTSPPFGIFGPVPLAPVLLSMVPGSRYLVWVWCWQTSRMGPDDAFIAFLQVHMPFVSVNAGPPIVVR